MVDGSENAHQFLNFMAQTKVPNRQPKSHMQMGAGTLPLSAGAWHLSTQFSLGN